MMNDDTYFGQVRHWLVTNVSTSADGSLSLSQDTTTSPYGPPSPLPNYMYARPHRYVFILARGSGKVDVTSEDLRELQKPYVAAMAGKQGETQDLKDRWGFNAQKFVEMKGLKVEAVNFMRVGGTLKSAAATTALMGQAMVNKVRSMNWFAHFVGVVTNFVILGNWKVAENGDEVELTGSVYQLRPHTSEKIMVTVQAR
jgi:hypothetical protein